MPYEIKKGKKVFTVQPEYEYPGCNCELLEKHETATKVFPSGWRMNVDQKTLNKWIKEKKAKPYKHIELEAEQSQILDAKEENIIKLKEK